MLLCPVFSLSMKFGFVLTFLSLKLARGLKNSLDCRFYDFINFFEKRSLKLQQFTLKIRGNGLLSICILASEEAHFEVICPVFAPREHLSTYTVASFIIFNPLEILNAAWRYQTSNLFLEMSVNRALLAPS